MSNVGKMLHNRRKELGFTLETVGKQVGVGRSLVCKWEKGVVKNMGCNNLVAVARVLHIDPVDIFKAILLDHK